MKNISGKVVSIYCVLGVLLIMGGGSLFAQHVLGYAPCKLCLIQRYCVACSVILLVCSLMVQEYPRPYKKVIDCTCVALFLGFIAAAYQLLVQYRILAEPDFCRVNLPNNVSLEELEEIIRQNTVVSCADFGPTIFDFPMSAYSAVAFLFLFVYFSLTSNPEE